MYEAFTNLFFTRKKLFIVCLWCIVVCTGESKNLFNGIKLDVSTSGTTSSGSYAPLWLSSNKYGTVSPYDNSAYERIGLFRSLTTDSVRLWRLGYGIDLMLNQHSTSTFFIQQAYVEGEYKKVNLSIGAKERTIDLRNNELTSGGLSNGINAHPIPQLRMEIDYFSIPGTHGWWKWKMRGSFGMTTDGNWQKNFVRDGHKYTSNTLYHEKAIYWKFGKEDHPKVPLTYEIGIQMFTQFGGKAYNVNYREHISGTQTIDMPENLKAFWQAIFGGGRDVTDFTESNNVGNMLGSYNMRLAWHGHTASGKAWEVGAYFERYFEDQSMLTLQYGIQDHLIGIDATLPANKFVSSVVIEHMSTRNQSGAVYHDRTKSIPDKMNGKDNYYNHSIYSGWQHWGQAIGNPLLTSPIYNGKDHIYNEKGRIHFFNNRVKAWHIGLSGDPTTELHWRLLMTFSQNWGTYNYPFKDVQNQQYYMAEIGWKPQTLKGWSGKIAFGLDHGDLIGNSFGAQLTVHKTFSLTK